MQINQKYQEVTGLLFIAEVSVLRGFSSLHEDIQALLNGRTKTSVWSL